MEIEVEPFNIEYIVNEHSDKSLATPKQKSKRIKRPNVSSSTKKEWSCQKCKKWFPSNKLLYAHRKAHKVQDLDEVHSYKYDESQEIYICNTCSAEFQTKDEIEKHIADHDAVFECTPCNETFKKAYDYATHMFIHNKDMQYHCPLCSYKSEKKRNLLVHINYLHLRKFYYGCETCGKRFNDVVFFKEHENEHLGIRPFICVVCDKSFIYSRYLATHQIRCHHVTVNYNENNGENPKNQCVICFKSFSKVSTLKEHMEIHENNDVPLKKHLCDVCGQGFSRKDKLKIHYRTHTGDKPYSCSYCGKSFIKKDYLIMHERVHSGEKPYVCQYCGKGFNQGAPLRIHIRSHTGDRPYICDFCNVGFASKAALNLHKKACKA